MTKRKPRVQRSVEEIVRRYDRVNKSKTDHWVTDIVAAYLNGTIGKYGRRNYRMAADVIRQREAVKTVAPDTNIVPTTQINGTTEGLKYQLSQVTTDPYEKLEKAERMMVDAVLEIAELEAQSRAEKKVQALTSEYEEKIERMEKVLEKAQSSSVVGLLRSKFGQ